MAQPEIFRLTNADFSQAAFLPFADATGTALATVPSGAGLSVTFDFYSYSGTGGDGISFFLVDGSQPLDRAGGFGGSLGYAPRLTDTGLIPGILGGYVGIGFDEFGNFSSDFEGRTGGIGTIPNSVTVRGSETTNYAFLDSVVAPIDLDNPDPTATQANSKRTAQVNLSAAGDLQVSLDINQNGLFTDPGETLLSFNLIAKNGALPTTFRFGFAASTGGTTNIHEVGNVSVKDASGNVIAANLVASLIVRNPNTDSTVDRPVGGSGNDIIQTGGGNDSITGQAGGDIVVGGSGADTISGGAGADIFYFRGASKAEALKDSTLSSLDRITDFSFAEGDRFGLDFDNNLETIERPRRLFNAGKEKGNLQKAAKSAYADKNQKRRGDQALKADEAVFFRRGSRTFLSVNDGKAGFSVTNDLLVDVTGIQFKSGDARKGGLKVGNYFV